jgi:Ni/Fe-hydrogenase subunit HybB-like protein
MSELLLASAPSDAQLDSELLGTTARPSSAGLKLAIGVSMALTGLLTFCIIYTISVGIGAWGNDIPVAWAFGIVNFVWWIGIGHAGTFISAILYLLEQPWRNSISRLSEAMTLFAVAQAALFPLLHLGRPWFAYWLFPYPAVMDVWPNVRSALPWDAAAVTTYGLVSLMFWYLGLLPDLAGLRDHSPRRWQRIGYGLLAIGFRGDAHTWRHYRSAYLLFAGMATPLVVSVHSIVASDFAIGLTPGWHSTLMPPFFVAGAIFSGFAMVLTLVIPIRAAFSLHDVITVKHLDNCAKLLLTTGLMVSYGYLVEFFLAWYSDADPEFYQAFTARPFGPGRGVFWTMLLCNVLIPQLMWWKRARTHVGALLVVALAVDLGMWCERFVIIVASLQREFLPSKWHAYAPSWIDLGLLLGTLGFFTLLILLFLRFLPFISASEVKELKHELDARSS